MTKLEYLLKQYETIAGWYDRSEEKAKFVVSVNSLAIGVVNGLVFLSARDSTGVRALYSPVVLLLLALTGLALLASYFFVLKAVWARHRGRAGEFARHERLWFFGDLASLAAGEHKALVEDWTEQQLEQTLTVQNHTLAGNVRAKFDAINVATTLTIVALALLLPTGAAYLAAALRAAG